MPQEYETLVAALKLTDIPFAEYGWKARPEGTYGVVGLDFESGSLRGDSMKQDRSWRGTVDVFFQKLADRTGLIAAIEEILTEICGGTWELNSIQYETETSLFHVEWEFHITGTVTADEGEDEA